jgi:hypothetical protein
MHGKSHSSTVSCSKGIWSLCAEKIVEQVVKGCAETFRDPVQSLSEEVEGEW